MATKLKRKCIHHTRILLLFAHFIFKNRLTISKLTSSFLWNYFGKYDNCGCWALYVHVDFFWLSADDLRLSLYWVISQYTNVFVNIFNFNYSSVYLNFGYRRKFMWKSNFSSIFLSNKIALNQSGGEDSAGFLYVFMKQETAAPSAPIPSLLLLHAIMNKTALFFFYIIKFIHGRCCWPTNGHFYFQSIQFFFCFVLLLLIISHAHNGCAKRTICMNVNVFHSWDKFKQIIKIAASIIQQTSFFSLCTSLFFYKGVFNVLVFGRVLCISFHIY